MPTKIRVLLLVFVLLTLRTSSLLATSQDGSYTVHFWLLTTSQSQAFPALATNKKWNGGTIEDYTSNHNLGRSRSTGKEPGWCLALQPNGSWAWNLGDGKGRLDYQPTSKRQPINDGAWHHLGFSISAERKEARLYYDGKNVAIYSLSGLATQRRDSPVLLGTQAEDRTFRVEGQIEDLTIRDTVLTEKDIASLWQFSKRRSRSDDGWPAKMPSSPVRQVKVLAWNIWHGGRRDGNEIGLQKTVETLRASGADIVAMQETYGSGARIADALNYSFYLRSTNLSVMSRYPLRDTQDIYQPFRLGGVTVELSPGQKINVFSLWINHLPDYGKSMLEKRPTVASLVEGDRKTRGAEIHAILEGLSPLIARTDSVPLIVAGDYNSPSHLDWTEATRKKHHDLVVPWPVSVQMAQAGFRDAFRQVHPDPAAHPGRTWSPRFSDAWQDRIDYVYYHGAGLTAVDARMLDHHEAGWPSDHAAVLVTFRLSPSKE